MTTSTLSLADFLLARITEDEAAARECLDPENVHEVYRQIHGGSELTAALHDEFPDVYRGDVSIGPARVLAECAAKRRIVEECQKLEDKALDANAWYIDHHEHILRALASVYADHSDYLQEWAL